MQLTGEYDKVLIVTAIIGVCSIVEGTIFRL